MSTALYFDQQRGVPVWQGPAAQVIRREPARTPGTAKTLTPEGWVVHGRCRDNDPDALFVRGAQQRSAASVCRPCPVRQRCLATALDNREEFGVWGGLTERERRALLRTHTDIDSWEDHLAAGGSLSGI